MAEKLQFTFKLLESSDQKSNVLCVTSITTADGREWQIPNEFKPLSKHTSLHESYITKIKNSLKRRGQYRKIWISLDEDMRKVYLDEEGNLQFGNQYLNETINENNVQNSTIVNNNESGNKMRNLASVSERFTINKFSGKTSNASQWLEEFETECTRFDLNEDDKKIEMLKFMLEKNCQDWYTSMMIKYTVESTWHTWATKFLQTYGNKGWSHIKYAFNYKYQNGSILEYATKKERLILEINRVIDDSTMIFLIVMGLPDNIMNKIERESLTTTTDLFKEISQYEYLAKKKEWDKPKPRYDYKAANQRTPCSICNKLKKGERFHPESRCYFKDHDVTRRIQSVNNSIETELVEEEQKNE